MTSVRFDDTISQKLSEIASYQNTSKSAIIKIAVLQYLDKEESQYNRLYETGKDVFGKYGSGKSNLSTDYKSIIHEQLNEKYNH